MRVEHRAKRPATQIVSWRRDQLLTAGFGAPLAQRIARDTAFDLHALLELVERGCPPPLAVRILAPLEQRPGEAR
jgi:hypothetical protein